MRHGRCLHESLARLAALSALVVTALVGCAREGPAIEARSQSIAFAAPPAPAVNQPTVTVVAAASSGLAVRFGGLTPAVCSVEPSSGVVTGTASGTCTVSADQAGDTRYAPAPQVTQEVRFTFQDALVFQPAPALSVHDLATVTANGRTSQPVSYASATPAACTVDGAAGLVVALATGDCTIVATSGALQAEVTITITAPPIPGPPGAPTGVSATAETAPGTATIQVGATRANGSPITGYAVTSSPPGVTATGAASPLTVACPASCAGYRFSVVAQNALGPGPPSGPAEVITRYDVVAVFHEPDTQPRDSVFVGGYTLNGSTGVVSSLRGRLSESMTGGKTPWPDDTMTWLPLDHQRSALPVTLDGVDGLLVTSFLNDATATLSDDPRFGGTDGWSPGTGAGLHFGYPGPNPGNAYARIFVNLADPLAALTQGQLDKLAYADCAPGGMMGATCMTGTAVAGYGTAGTMGGRPVSQSTTRP